METKTTTLGPPPFIRAPMRGPEYWSQVSRTMLYRLEKEGKIRSVSLAEPGQKKGTKLFDLASIFAYYERQAAKATARQS